MNGASSSQVRGESQTWRASPATLPGRNWPPPSRRGLARPHCSRKSTGPAHHRTVWWATTLRGSRRRPSVIRQRRRAAQPRRRSHPNLAAGRGHPRGHDRGDRDRRALGLRRVPAAARSARAKAVCVKGAGLCQKRSRASPCAGCRSRRSSAGVDDWVRLAASIRAGKVSAAHAIHRLGSAAVGDPLHRAAEHLGRLLRTLFLCDYLAIPDYRREIHTLLDRGESVHTTPVAARHSWRPGGQPSGAAGGRRRRPSRARTPC